MRLPEIINYGNYSSNNYGKHSLQISFDKLDLYYSYDTIIAFRTIETGLVICKNEWWTTTGKHLNWINPDKKIRIDREKFIEQLSKTLVKFNLV